jgi:hypothetical protein
MEVLTTSGTVATVPLELVQVRHGVSSNTGFEIGVAIMTTPTGDEYLVGSAFDENRCVGFTPLRKKYDPEVPDPDGNYKLLLGMHEFAIANHLGFFCLDSQDCGDLVDLTVLRVYDFTDERAHDIRLHYVLQHIAATPTSEPNMYQVAIMEEVGARHHDYDIEREEDDEDCLAVVDPRPEVDTFCVHTYLYNSATFELNEQDTFLCPQVFWRMRFGNDGILFAHDSRTIFSISRKRYERREEMGPVPGGSSRLFGWKSSTGRREIRDILPCRNGLLVLVNHPPAVWFLVPNQPHTLVWSGCNRSENGKSLAVVPSLNGLFVVGGHHDVLLLPPTPDVVSRDVTGMSALRAAWVTASLRATPSLKFEGAYTQPINKRKKTGSGSVADSVEGPGVHSDDREGHSGYGAGVGVGGGGSSSGSK